MSQGEAPLPEGVYHAELRCMTCGVHNDNIPTATVAEDMANAHLNDHLEHDVRAWLCMDPVEIPIKRRKSDGMPKV